MDTYFNSEMITMLNMMSCIRIDMNVCLHVDYKTFEFFFTLETGTSTYVVLHSINVSLNQIENYLSI